MSSIQLCAAHQATAAFDGDAIAQYMRTDFITLPEHFSVHEARELFVSQLASDEIPGQVFVVAGKKLRGSLSIKKLLQESDTAQSIRYLMDSCLFRVRPDDPRPQVVAELAERGLDLVPVVEKGELVGCLMEKEIAHLLEDDVTEDAQRQGRRCRWKSPTWKPARGRCGKNVRYGCCCSLSPKPIPAACCSILRKRWSRRLRWPFSFRC